MSSVHNQNSGNPTAKKAKHLKPKDLAISTGSQVFMTLGSYNQINTGLQTATAKTKDADNSLNMIEVKKKTPTNNSRPSTNYFHPPKKVRAVSGSSGNNAHISQLLQQQLGVELHGQAPQSKHSRIFAQKTPTHASNNPKLLKNITRHTQNANMVATRSVSNKKQAVAAGQAKKSERQHREGVVQQNKVQSGVQKNQQVVKQAQASKQIANFAYKAALVAALQKQKQQSTAGGQQAQNLAQGEWTGGQEQMQRVVEKGDGQGGKRYQIEDPADAQADFQLNQMFAAARGVIGIKGRRIETHGLTPRNAQENPNQIYIAEGNATTTNACNQSFQFPFQHHLGQTLISGSANNRAGSSETNKAKGRFRSGGSNKTNILIKGKEKNVNKATSLMPNSKKITINTNTAQILLGQPAISRGILTSKTAADGSKVVKVSSTKNSIGQNPLYLNVKNAITPGALPTQPPNFTQNLMIQTKSSLPTKKQTHIGRDGMSGATAQQFIPQPASQSQHSRGKVQQIQSNYNNILQGLNFIQERQPLTTKNADWSVQNQQPFGHSHPSQLNMEALHPDQAPKAEMPGTVKSYQVNRGPLAAHLLSSGPQKEQAPSNGHSTILNKFGQSNLINNKALQAREKHKNKNQAARHNGQPTTGWQESREVALSMHGQGRAQQQLMAHISLPGSSGEAAANSSSLNATLALSGNNQQHLDISLYESHEHPTSQITSQQNSHRNYQTISDEKTKRRNLRKLQREGGLALPEDGNDRTEQIQNIKYQKGTSSRNAGNTVHTEATNEVVQQRQKIEFTDKQQPLQNTQSWINKLSQAQPAALKKQHQTVKSAERTNSGVFINGSIVNVNNEGSGGQTGNANREGNYQASKSQPPQSQLVNKNLQPRSHAANLQLSNQGRVQNEKKVSQHFVTLEEAPKQPHSMINDIYDKKSQGSAHSKFSENSRQSEGVCISNINKNFLMHGQQISKFKNNIIISKGKTPKNNMATKISPHMPSKKMEPSIKNFPNYNTCQNTQNNTNVRQSQQQSKQDMFKLQQQKIVSKQTVIKKNGNRQTNNRPVNGQNLVGGEGPEQFQITQYLPQQTLTSQNSSGSLYSKLKIKKLQTVQQSMPNLNSHNQLHENNGAPEPQDGPEAPEQEKLVFYANELKKRDDIVLFLCQKMQGMESQIDLLMREQLNKSHNQNTSQMLKEGCPSPVDSSGLPVQSQLDNSKDFIRFISGILKPGSQLMGDATISSQQTATLLQHMLSFQKNTSNDDTNFKEDLQTKLRLKLNDTSADYGEELEEMLESFNLQTQDDANILNEAFADQLLPALQPERQGKGSLQFIENKLEGLQERLNEFKEYNNPKRLADLRRFCATSITHTSKSVSGGVSGRLQHSGGNSGGLGNNKTTARHFQSASDLDAHSLITVDENNAKMVRGYPKLESNQSDVQAAIREQALRPEELKLDGDRFQMKSLRSEIEQIHVSNAKNLKDNNFEQNMPFNSPVSPLTGTEDEELQELEKMMRLQNHSDSIQNSQTLLLLEKDWKRSQEASKNQKTNSSNKIMAAPADLSAFRHLGAAKQFNQTQKVKFDHKIINDPLQGRKESENYGKGVGQAMDDCHLEDIEDVQNWDAQALSKTQSKDAMMKKLKKQNFMSIKLGKMSQVQPKIKIIGQAQRQNPEGTRNPTTYNEAVLASQNQKLPKFKVVGDHPRQIKQNNFFNAQRQHQQFNLEEEKLSDHNIHSMERQLQQLNEMDENENLVVQQSSTFQAGSRFSQEVSLIDNNNASHNHVFHDNSVESGSIVQIVNQSYRCLQGQGQGNTRQSDRNMHVLPNFYGQSEDLLCGHQAETQLEGQQAIQINNLSLASNQLIDTTFQPINTSQNGQHITSAGHAVPLFLHNMSLNQSSTHQQAADRINNQECTLSSINMNNSTANPSNLGISFNQQPINSLQTSLTPNQHRVAKKKKKSILVNAPDDGNGGKVVKKGLKINVQQDPSRRVNNIFTSTGLQQPYHSSQLESALMHQPQAPIHELAPNSADLPPYKKIKRKANEQE